MSALAPGPTQSAWSQLRELRTDFLGYLVRAARAHGDLVRLRPAPGATIHLVNSPRLVEDVLVQRAPLFRKSAMTGRMVRKFLGEGLVLAEGDAHRRQRRIAQPAFQPRRVVASAEAVSALAEKLADGWADGATIDLEREATSLAMQIAASVLFGADALRADADLGAAMHQFAESIAGRFRSIPLPEWLPTPRHRREQRAVATMGRAVDAMLAARRAAGNVGEDVLGTLVRAEQEGDGRLSATELRDSIATLYFAGHETSAKVLTWTLALLARHPEIEDETRAEIDAVLAGRRPRPEDVDQLPKLDAVLRESLRLFPPTWVFDRAPAEPIELGGFRLAAGATIYVSPYVAHRDPRYWPDPERFDPSRFAAGWEQRVPRHAYFPFGAGPRNCIGRAMAELHAKLALVAILQRARLTANDEAPLRGYPGATLRPATAIQLRVARR